MTTTATSLRQRYGKPLDYARLGKSFGDGADFMEHMRSAAARLVRRCDRDGTLQRTTVCPVCLSTSTSHLLDFQGFEYRRCDRGDCRHGFVATLLPEDVRGAFFRDDPLYGRHNYCDARRAAFRVEHIAAPKVEHVLHELDQGGCAATGERRWLDVGCGSGEVLAAVAQHEGWSAVGLELSERQAEFARATFGVEVRVQPLAELLGARPRQRFDVVSLFGVLHCVAAPTELAAQGTEALNPGGHLVCEVTNVDAVTTSAIATFPNHPTRSSFNGVTTLHQFSRDSIQRTFAQCGLEPVSVWYYGTDVHELLNQWWCSEPRLAEGPLAAALSGLANDLQRCMDEAQQCSHMLWIARKPG